MRSLRKSGKREKKTRKIVRRSRSGKKSNKGILLHFSKSRKRGGVKENKGTFFSSIPYPPGVKAPITDSSYKSDFFIEPGEENLIAPDRMPLKNITILKNNKKEDQREKPAVQKYNGLDIDEADIDFVGDIPTDVTVRDERVTYPFNYHSATLGKPFRRKENKPKVPMGSILEEVDIDADKENNDYGQFIELGGKKNKKSSKRKKNASRRKKTR